VIAGLVLAAGRGSRFGSDPKLLADINGRPALQWTVETMTQVSTLERVVVVLGAHAEQLRSQIRFGRAETVTCERWQEGQSASLRCGVDMLEDVQKILVTLGDQPLMTPRMVERFTREPPGARATYHGIPGHPVVLGPGHIRAIRGLTGDRGARELLDGPLIETAQLGVPRDLDTPEDLTVIRREASRAQRLDSYSQLRQGPLRSQ
jgi:molybdenum cofactor cytidylyltransferase